MLWIIQTHIISMLTLRHIHKTTTTQQCECLTWQTYTNDKTYKHTHIQNDNDNTHIHNIINTVVNVHTVKWLINTMANANYIIIRHTHTIRIFTST